MSTEELKITPYKMCEIMQSEGHKVSQETHWFESCMECTKESSPYSLIIFRAHKR